MPAGQSPENARGVENPGNAHGEKGPGNAHGAESPENAHGAESLENARGAESPENAHGAESSRMLTRQRVQRKATSRECGRCPRGKGLSRAAMIREEQGEDECFAMCALHTVLGISFLCRGLQLWYMGTAQESQRPRAQEAGTGSTTHSPGRQSG